VDVDGLASRAGKPDTGIDLVHEERDGSGLTAISASSTPRRTRCSSADIDCLLHRLGKRLLVPADRLDDGRWEQAREMPSAASRSRSTRLRVQDLDESSIDWSQFSLRTPEVMSLKDRRSCASHQCRRDVRDGLAAADRGKLIMACGTARPSPPCDRGGPASAGRQRAVPGAVDLAAVPDAEGVDRRGRGAAAALRSLLDTKVGKRPTTRTSRPYDLAFPLHRPEPSCQRGIAGDGSRSRSSSPPTSPLPVVAARAGLGMADFDLIVCDEAHRLQV
jgi:hypothetical protein